MADVYFISSRVKKYKGLYEKFKSLLNSLDLDFIKPNDQVLIKTHFGEDGNTTYVNPLYIRLIVDYLKEKKALPFVGDTNTLYSGRRKKGVSHLELANDHGFSYATIRAPIVILDGVKGNFRKNIEVNQKHFDTVQLAGSLFEADSVIMVSHVKGHMVAGMGAAVKNLSMGFGTRAQKQRMHGDIKPELSEKKCVLCNKCVTICPENAISVKNKKIEIDIDACVGCAECIINCPTGALKVLWNESPDNLAEKMSETALGVVKNKKGKIFYFNFLLNITPDCDCAGWSDNPVINDIGILASDDPIAIDKAGFDLINKQKPLKNSKLADKDGEVFHSLHPGINPIHQLNYGEEIGLGSREYELIIVE